MNKKIHFDQEWVTSGESIDVVGRDLIETPAEYILCAAVWYQDGIKYEHQPKNVESGIVVAGRRHHNCFFTIFQLRGKGTINKNAYKQGFITSKDRYVTRREAFVIAKAAGQLVFSEKLNEADSASLFSEDLY